MDSLNAYARKLEAALAGREPYIEYNRDMAHAAIVVSAAFRHGQKDIWLLSHKLDRSLYASFLFLTAAEEFIKRGGTLHVLVETDVEASHPLRVLARNSGQIQVKRVPDELLASYKFNFLVVDDVGCRLENDREETKALVMFNGDSGPPRDIVPRLKEIYRDLEDASQTL